MRQSKLAYALLAFTLLGSVSCTKEKKTAPISSEAASGSTTLSGIQAEIFVENCSISGCHNNTANPAGSINMSTADHSFAALVNKMSEQASMQLVVPGDAGNSYLMHKLNGTHPSVGGTGDRMPQYASRLSAAKIDQIVTWINDGAQRN